MTTNCFLSIYGQLSARKPDHNSTFVRLLVKIDPIFVCIYSASFSNGRNGQYLLQIVDVALQYKY